MFMDFEKYTAKVFNPVVNNSQNNKEKIEKVHEPSIEKIDVASKNKK